MQIRLLIISSLLLLALFAIKSYSVDWDNPENYKSADDLISSSNNNYYIPLSEQAHASRAAQVGQSGKDILSVPYGSNPSPGANIPQQTRSQELNPTVATPTVTASTNVPATPTVPSELAIVSGSWTIELNDSASKKAILTIFQNGDTVYGTGNLNLDANTAMPIIASGTVTGNQVNLNIVSFGKTSLYRIIMTISGDAATGSYFIYSPGSSPSNGAVKGLRSGS